MVFFRNYYRLLFPHMGDTDEGYFIWDLLRDEFEHEDDSSEYEEDGSEHEEDEEYVDEFYEDKDDEEEGEAVGECMMDDGEEVEEGIPSHPDDELTKPEVEGNENDKDDDGESLPDYETDSEPDPEPAEPEDRNEGIVVAENVSLVSLVYSRTCIYNSGFIHLLGLDMEIDMEQKSRDYLTDLAFAIDLQAVYAQEAGLFPTDQFYTAALTELWRTTCYHFRSFRIGRIENSWSKDMCIMALLLWWNELEVQMPAVYAITPTSVLILEVVKHMLDLGDDTTITCSQYKVVRGPR